MTDRINFFLRSIFRPWILFGSVGIGLLLSAGALLIIPMRRPEPEQPKPPTALITLLPAASPTIPGIAAPTTTPEITPTMLPSPFPGTFALGTTVQISGTGGDGLNLRSVPSLDSSVRYLGFEQEVFIIQDGPREKDGFTWWFLVGFNNEDRNGWAVSNYLTVVQQPE